MMFYTFLAWGFVAFTTLLMLALGWLWLENRRDEAKGDPTRNPLVTPLQKAANGAPR